MSNYTVPVQGKPAPVAADLLPPGMYNLEVTGLFLYNGISIKSNAPYQSWIINFKVISPTQYVGKRCPGIFVPFAYIIGNKLDKAVHTITGKSFTEGESPDLQTLLVGKRVDALIGMSPSKKKPGEFENKIMEIYPVNMIANVNQPPAQQPIPQPVAQPVQVPIAQPAPQPVYVKTAVPAAQPSKSNNTIDF